MKNWSLYPQKDFSGDGTTVAICYKDDLPICIVRSYSRYYRAEILNLRKEMLDIPYNCIKLKRLRKKLNKKRKRGYLTSEQHTNIMLKCVCNMTERLVAF